MDCLWYVGQAGILVELFGAGLGVYYAWQTREDWSSSSPAGTYDSISDDLARPGREFMAQYRKQLYVFGPIGVGLIMQFIGNFANR